VERLLAAFREVDAYSRVHTEQRLAPNASHLTSGGHLLLMTNLGPLDVLGTVETRTVYDDLLRDVIEMDIEAVPVKVLGLARLIALKENAARPKDIAVLAMLRATFEQSLKTRNR
jgi:predicted nucleotidyltransferase